LLDTSAQTCAKPEVTAVALINTLPEGVVTASVVPTPHWPFVFIPQHLTPPVDVMITHVKYSPAEMALAALPRAIVVDGLERAVVVPSPSW
jgi:coenzyme F420-reducing hydrogenase beta subunit